MKQVNTILKDNIPFKHCVKCKVLLPLTAYSKKRNTMIKNTCDFCLEKQNTRYKRIQEEKKRLKE